MRILIVEDEIKLATSLHTILEAEGYVVEMVHDGQEGYEQAGVEDYDLLLLDINLPSMDGLNVCKSLREEGIRTPILMLTARDTTQDKVKGLDVGADDYLIKPFEVEELLARVRALIRRESQATQAELKADSLSLNTKSKVVKRAGKEIQLSAKEYALLEYLLQHKGTIVSKELLIDHVWGSEVDPFSNVVDVYIGYLRKKVDKAFGKEQALITTVKGMGYRIL